MTTLEDLAQYKNPQKAKDLSRFFKTGKGDYGEGDQFWGIVVPITRSIARAHKDADLSEITALMTHSVHEVRLCGLLILVEYAKHYPEKACEVYLTHTTSINNWDLVDLTAEHIVGPIASLDTLIQLSHSPLLWDRRIAIISTFYFIKRNDPQPTLRIATELVHDTHDLIHKAVGWMLREVGKRVSEDVECVFLDRYAATMPRTMLRYAIERFEPEKRQCYLQFKN
jgi:3-methyladenine DNA glycosylase AlkD